MRHDHQHDHEQYGGDTATETDRFQAWKMRKGMRRGPRGAGHFEHRGRMRRGEIRTALLSALAEEPGHGYEIMQRLEEKSGGAWRPSPGSVYPTLQMLEDEGLVRSEEREGKRVFEITDAGRVEATRRAEEAGGSPWETDGKTSPWGQLKEAIGGIALAARQIAHAGDEDQVQRAVEIVRDARKQLYRILSED